MNRLKVSTRLMILIGVLSALLIGVAGVGLFGILKSNAALKAVYEVHTVPTAHLGEIEATLMGTRLAIAMALATPAKEVLDESVSTIESNSAAIDKLWATFLADHLDERVRPAAMALADSRKVLVQQGLDPTLAALRAGDYRQTEQLLVEKIRPLFQTVKANVDAMKRLHLQLAKADYDEAATRFEATRLWAVAALGAGLSFAGVCGLLLVRSISRELGAEPAEAAAVAQRVAAGDLSTPIRLRPGDSQSLMAQLQLMQASLGRVVGQVRGNAESVAAASAQIAQGNAELSQRTEQQASSLQQTAATMEELGSTARNNTDNARQANQLAQSASGVAVQGGQVVDRVVETMKGISESSTKIAEIIGTIDGIAFQTNILALNAAVEAARAGEQGRGFAVVAGEVRILAQRSAEAAREIKHLITASVERVEQGATLVDHAGRTMDEVVASIKRVCDIVGEISAASTEQHTGVQQVGAAVGQMDLVTQQNAALVEESAAAAETLRNQAAALVKAVGVFRLAPTA